MIEDFRLCADCSNELVCSDTLRCSKALAPGTGSGGGLASRWTEAQIEDARRIVNDIAEDMENPRDTKKKLRQALAIYADLLWDANVTRSNKESERLFAALRRIEAFNRTSQNTELRSGHDE
jgi:hypothetical protein